MSMHMIKIPILILKTQEKSSISMPIRQDYLSENKQLSYDKIKKKK